MITNNYVDRTRGGVEMHVFNLARALTRQGHLVEVARTSPGPSIFEHGETIPLATILGDRPENQRGISRRLQKISLLRFGANFIGRIFTAIKAGKILRSDPEYLKSFDIIHHHDFVASVLISRMIAPLGLTQVWTNHLGEFLMLRRIPVFGSRLTKTLTRSFARGIGPSAELSDQLTVACPIEYISNGVDTELFAPLEVEEQSVLREKLGWRKDRLIAVVPRRWAPTKGVIFAAAAMSSPLWPENCDVVFAGAGESDFPEYSTQIREALAVTSVPYTIMDSLSMVEMAEAVQGADFCIIPSLMEATSLSALEAMAAGLPVIGTCVGGLPEIIEEGVNGHLVPAEDSDAIAASVARICSLKTDQRRDFGRAARERIASFYSWNEISRKTLEVYEKASV